MNFITIIVDTKEIRETCLLVLKSFTIKPTRDFLVDYILFFAHYSLLVPQSYCTKFFRIDYYCKKTNQIRKLILNNQPRIYSIQNKIIFLLKLNRVLGNKLFYLTSYPLHYQEKTLSFS